MRPPASHRGRDKAGCELADMYDENGTFVFILHCRHHSQSQIDRT